MAGLVCVMFLAALAVVLFPPARGTPDLAERVRGYREHEPPAAERSADPSLGRNKRSLADYRDDAAFAGLPEELQAFVVDRLQEIDSYQAYRGKLAVATAPATLRRSRTCSGVEQAARSRANWRLPTMAWEGTPAAGTPRKVAGRCAGDSRCQRRTFLAALSGLHSPSHGPHARRLVRRELARRCRRTRGGGRRGRRRILPNPSPAHRSLEHPRGRALTYRMPYEFQRVYEARRDWGRASRLLRFRDLADALALTEGPDRTRAALVLPEPGSGVTPRPSRHAALRIAFHSGG